MEKIILATKSPYRQDAFRGLGLDFVAEGSDVKEDFAGRPKEPEKLVLHLAKLKAEAVAKNHNEGIVIGFDSIGWHDGKPLEKVKSREEAFHRLKRLSGGSFQFFTGVYMINKTSGKVISRAVRTDIEMRVFSEREIDKYLDQDPRYMTYADGLISQNNLSSTFARSIKGSYNNFLIGIPLEAIMEMLIEMGYKI